MSGEGEDRWERPEPRLYAESNSNSNQKKVKSNSKSTHMLMILVLSIQIKRLDNYPRLSLLLRRITLIVRRITEIIIVIYWFIDYLLTILTEMNVPNYHATHPAFAHWIETHWRRV